MIIGGLRPGNPQTNRPNKFGANVQETMVGSTALLYISIGTNLFITCGVSKVREIPHENAWFWEIETHGYSKQTFGLACFSEKLLAVVEFFKSLNCWKNPEKKKSMSCKTCCSVALAAIFAKAILLFCCKMVWKLFDSCFLCKCFKVFWRGATTLLVVELDTPRQPLGGCFFKSREATNLVVWWKRR